MSGVPSTAVPSDRSAFEDRAERDRYLRARAQARRLRRADSARRDQSVAPPSAGASPVAQGWPVRHIAAAPVAPAHTPPAPAEPARPRRVTGLLTKLGLF